MSEKDEYKDKPPKPSEPGYRVKLEHWYRRNLDELEREIGEAGKVEGLSGLAMMPEFMRERAYEVESQLTAAWYSHTGELPQGESEKPILQYVREQERLASCLESEVRHVENWRAAGAVSGMDATAKRRKNSETQREKASNPRKPITAIYNKLAREPGSPAELWGALIGDMEAAHMAPIEREKGKRIDYEDEVSGMRQRLTFKTFANALSSRRSKSQ